MNTTLTGNEKRFLENPPMQKADDGNKYVVGRNAHDLKMATSLEQKGFLEKVNCSFARWKKTEKSLA